MSENILYIPEIDISESNGSGINERNFVKNIIDQNIFLLIPNPKFELEEDIRKSKNVFFSYGLNRRNPLKYLIYLLSKIFWIAYISCSKNISRLVFRWGIFPIDILFFGVFTDKNIYLKHLTFLQTTQKEGIAHDLIGFFRSFVIKRNIISGCDTPSFKTKEIIKNSYKIKNILIAKNGTEKILDKDAGERNKEFIYMGRLSKKRNTDKLLSAFQQAGKNIDIYGYGEMVPTVSKFANEHDNINFHGKVDYDYLNNQLPKYKFGIDLTYIETEYGKASYSQKIAQYLAYGLNVIAIDCCDNKFIADYSIGQLIDLDKDELERIIVDIKFSSFEPKICGDYVYNDSIAEKRIDFWNQELG